MILALVTESRKMSSNSNVHECSGNEYYTVGLFQFSNLEFHGNS